MPRIDAAATSVAEHSALRRAAILRASASLLRTGGVAAVTPAAVAGQAGLARSSLYQYYGSTGALVQAAVEEMFAGFAERLDAALAQADSPGTRLDAYVAATLQSTTEGHGPSASLTEAELPEPCRVRLRELHHAITDPLYGILRDLHAERPGADPQADTRATAELVLGVLLAASGQLERGADLEATTRRTQAFVADALGVVTA